MKRHYAINLIVASVVLVIGCTPASTLPTTQVVAETSQAVPTMAQITATPAVEVITTPTAARPATPTARIAATPTSVSAATATPAFAVKETWTSYTNPNLVSAVALDQQGILWIGGSGGAIALDLASREYTLYRVEDGLAGNMVQDIAVDQNGAVWFAVFGSGVSRFDGKTWTTFTQPMGWPVIGCRLSP